MQLLPHFGFLVPEVINPLLIAKVSNYNVGTSTSPSVSSNFVALGAPAAQPELFIGAVMTAGKPTYTQAANFNAPFDLQNTFSNPTSFGGWLITYNNSSAVTYAPTIGSSLPWVAMIIGLEPGASGGTATEGSPSVLNVAPPTGTAAGGTTITITGNNFLNAISVTIGTVPAQSFSVINNSTITAITPPVPNGVTPGPVSVVVTTTVGSNPANTAYSYAAAATASTPVAISSVTATGNSGSGAGSSTVLVPVGSFVLVVFDAAVAQSQTFTAFTDSGSNSYTIIQQTSINECLSIWVGLLLKHNDSIEHWF